MSSEAAGDEVEVIREEEDSARDPSVDPDGVAQPGRSDQEIHRLVEDLYSNPRNQATYPGEGQTEEEGPPRDRPSLAMVLRLVLYTVVAFALALILYLAYDLARFLWQRWARRQPTAPESPPTLPLPAAEAPPTASPDPESLAREGRFGEAVHALFLLAVPLVSAHRLRPWPPGTTGREIATSVDLPATPGRALALLVAAVEHFLFARRPLTEEDWEVCRGAFEELRAGLAEAATPALPATGGGG